MYVGSHKKVSLVMQIKIWNGENMTYFHAEETLCFIHHTSETYSTQTVAIFERRKPHVLSLRPLPKSFIQRSHHKISSPKV